MAGGGRPRRKSLKRNVRGLITALNLVTSTTDSNNDNDNIEDDATSGSSSSTTTDSNTNNKMNLDAHYHHSHKLAPTMVHSNDHHRHHFAQHYQHQLPQQHDQYHQQHEQYYHHAVAHDLARVSPPTSSSSNRFENNKPTTTTNGGTVADGSRSSVTKKPTATTSSPSPIPPLTDFLPPLLKQAKKQNGGVGNGLGKIPQRTLYDSLQPVIHALQELDATSLLDLATITSKAPGCGPKVSDGVYCRPIIDDIKPPLNSLEYLRNGHSCVRYLHIAEVPDQYSIGVFVFGPYARIPLHDHPDMCVLSRVLYGDLQRQSLDLARESDIVKNNNDDVVDTNTTPSANATTTAAVDDDMDCEMSGSTSSLGSSWSLFSRPSWFNSSRQNGSSLLRSSINSNGDGTTSGLRSSLASSAKDTLPAGSKYAYRNCVDHLEAPGVTVLYPYEGNLHEFVAGEHGAAVLDVLLPPYDNEQNRDCTFYNITDLLNSAATGPSSSSSLSKLKPQQGKDPCLIIPTGQPETFHCISGTYRDLGEEDDDDDDEN